MQKRHVRTFLMVSTAFFAMNLPVRSANADMLTAAVSHTTQLTSAGVGEESPEPLVEDDNAATRARRAF